MTKLVFSSQNTNSINNIKDMLAGLPQFQEGKEAYSLHLGMAQDCMNVFQERRLADVASVEQVCHGLKSGGNQLNPAVTCDWPGRGLQKA